MNKYCKGRNFLWQLDNMNILRHHAPTGLCMRYFYPIVLLSAHVTSTNPTTRSVAFGDRVEYAPPAFSIQFKSGMEGMRVSLRLDGDDMPLMVDTGSPITFVDPTVAHEWEGLVQLTKRIKFQYAGGMTARSRAYAKLRLDDFGVDDKIFVAYMKQIPEDIVGVLSLGPKSFLGKRLFALEPSRSEYGALTYKNIMSDGSLACATHPYASVALDRDGITNEHIFSIPNGSIRVGRSRSDSSILIATGKAGLELPPDLYDVFTRTLKKNKIITESAPKPRFDYLFAPEHLCYRTNSYKTPDITITLGKPRLTFVKPKQSISITFRFADYTTPSNGYCVIQVTRARNPDRIAIGNMVLGKLVSIFDASAGSVKFCPV
jgi:hypothetical protein